jgi:hypothetical protein
MVEGKGGGGAGTAEHIKYDDRISGENYIPAELTRRGLV